MAETKGKEPEAKAAARAKWGGNLAGDRENKEIVSQPSHSLPKMRSKWVVYAGSVAGKCWRPSCGFRWLLCVTQAKSGGCCPMRSRSCWLKPWQPRGLRAAQHRKAAACCPITSQHSQQVQPLPHRRSHHSEEPRKTMPPLCSCARRSAAAHTPAAPSIPASGWRWRCDRGSRRA